MVIHEDGYVGIGTTAPSTRLHVYSNTSGVIATISGPNSYNSETGISLAVDRAKISGVLNGSGGSPGASLRFHTQPDSGSLTERMRINSTGQVLAQAHGVSTPSFSFIGDNNTGMTRPTGDTLQFVTGGSERMRINSSDVMIGKNTSDINTQGFHVINSGTYTGAVYSGVTGSTANSTYHVRDTTNNTWKFYVTHAGVINATSTSIAGLSDERLKENIKDLETGLTEVMALKPRRFDWKEGEGSNKKNVAGFVAQEVETVLPDVIEGFMHDDLDNPKSVRMGDMLPTLVKAIQELKTKLEAAEARITTLEG